MRASVRALLCLARMCTCAIATVVSVRGVVSVTSAADGERARQLAKVHLLAFCGSHRHESTRTLPHRAHSPVQHHLVNDHKCPLSTFECMKTAIDKRAHNKVVVVDSLESTPSAVHHQRMRSATICHITLFYTKIVEDLIC